MWRHLLSLSLGLSVLSACGGQVQSSGPVGVSTPSQPVTFDASPLQGPAESNLMPASPVPASAQPMPSLAPTARPHQRVSLSERAERPAAAELSPSAALPQAAPQPPVNVQPSAPPQPAMAEQLLAQAAASFQSLNSFKIQVEGFEAGDDNKTSRLSFYMSSLQGHSKIEVTQHSNSLYVGVKMAYQSGLGTISVRPGGLLGFVKVDTRMDDERLLTPRGYRLDQIDAYAIAQRLLQNGQQVRVLGKTQFEGRSIAVLEYTQTPDFDRQITREVLGIDLEDHFVRMHEMYAGDKLVFSLKIRDVQLDLPLAAGDLRI